MGASGSSSRSSNSSNSHSSPMPGRTGIPTLHLPLLLLLLLLGVAKQAAKGLAKGLAGRLAKRLAETLGSKAAAATIVGVELEVAIVGQVLVLATIAGVVIIVGVVQVVVTTAGAVEEALKRTTGLGQDGVLLAVTSRHGPALAMLVGVDPRRRTGTTSAATSTRPSIGPVCNLSLSPKTSTIRIRMLCGDLRRKMRPCGRSTTSRFSGTRTPQSW
mmetsp:Transcript_52000/g.110508  ORF Transcript_52000/g.110508 Transcript_52000/m.110508 type:complete len:216 (-) Transcript_52000:1917-2564(-)